MAINLNDLYDQNARGLQRPKYVVPGTAPPPPVPPPPPKPALPSPAQMQTAGLRKDTPTAVPQVAGVAVNLADNARNANKARTLAANNADVLSRVKPAAPSFPSEAAGIRATNEAAARAAAVQRAVQAGEIPPAPGAAPTAGTQIPPEGLQIQPPHGTSPAAGTVGEPIQPNAAQRTINKGVDAVRGKINEVRAARAAKAVETGSRVVRGAGLARGAYNLAKATPGGFLAGSTAGGLVKTGAELHNDPESLFTDSNPSTQNFLEGLRPSADNTLLDKGKFAAAVGTKALINTGEGAIDTGKFLLDATGIRRPNVNITNSPEEIARLEARAAARRAKEIDSLPTSDSVPAAGATNADGTADNVNVAPAAGGGADFKFANGGTGTISRASGPIDAGLRKQMEEGANFQINTGPKTQEEADANLRRNVDFYNESARNSETQAIQNELAAGVANPRGLQRRLRDIGRESAIDARNGPETRNYSNAIAAKQAGYDNAIKLKQMELDAGQPLREAQTTNAIGEAQQRNIAALDTRLGQQYDLKTPQGQAQAEAKRSFFGRSNAALGTNDPRIQQTFSDTYDLIQGLTGQYNDQRGLLGSSIAGKGWKSLMGVFGLDSDTASPSSAPRAAQLLAEYLQNGTVNGEKLNDNSYPLIQSGLSEQLKELRDQYKQPGSRKALIAFLNEYQQGQPGAYDDGLRKNIGDRYAGQ